MANIEKTEIQGLCVIERSSFPDDRGFFREVFHLDELEDIIGIKYNIVQVNHSYSLPGVVRGIHADTWNKLVYPVSGNVFAAIADIRPESPTFGKVLTFEFTNEHRFALFVSKNLGNSFCVAGKDPVNLLYLVDDYYKGQTNIAVVWNDPDLNISWPVENAIVSEKDQQNPTLRQLFPQKFNK